jgi:hypothetical protein
MPLGGHALRGAAVEVDREHADSCLGEEHRGLIRLMPTSSAVTTATIS